MNRRAFSELPAEERREWYFRARQALYPDLRPIDPKIEQQIPRKARDIYYATFKERS